MTELTTIPEYNQTEQALTVLRENYAGVVFEVATPKGMAAAKEARAELRTLRVSLEKMRVNIKAPALQRCRLIDEEAKRITGELSKLEDPIDQTIKAEEGRKDAERAERARQAEAAARVLRDKLDAIRNRPFQVIGKPADAIKAMVEDTQALSVAEFPETMQAQQVLDETIARLITMHTERVAQDVEGARLAAARAELDRARQEQEAALAAQEDAARKLREHEAAELKRQQDELAAKQAESDRIERERRAEADKLAKAERDKQEAELRAQREAQEQQLAAERKRLAAEETERQRVAALERERLDNERRELDRQKEVAAQAERDRIAAERKQIEADRVEAARKAREQAIAQADLITSAREAVELLQDSGFGEHLTTLKLAAALAREATQLPEAA